MYRELACTHFLCVVNEAFPATAGEYLRDRPEGRPRLHRPERVQSIQPTRLRPRPTSVPAGGVVFHAGSMMPKKACPPTLSRVMPFSEEIMHHQVMGDGTMASAD